MVPCRGSCRAPAANGITDWNERPFGMLSSTAAATDNDTLVRVTSTIGAELDTSTVSATAPTTSVTSMLGKRPAVNSIPDCL